MRIAGSYSIADQFVQTTATAHAQPRKAAERNEERFSDE